MIANDDELKGTRARVAANPELYPSMASGHRVEIETMQREVLDYLTRHASQPLPAA